MVEKNSLLMRMIHHIKSYCVNIDLITRLRLRGNKYKALILCFAIFQISCVSPVKTSIFIKVKTKQQVKSVALENYVASVLMGEVPAHWPMEALKAQAIAIRTFALRRIKERRKNIFHVKDSIYDQVYKKNTLPIFKKAAKKTQGLVLTYNNKLVETSFHSTCGGHTARAKHVWGREYPYLKGVQCPYCKSSPAYHWQVQLKKSFIERRLGFKFNKISIYNRFSGNRVNYIMLDNKRIRAHDFRMKISPMKIRSTWITSIKNMGNTIVLKGRGFGHGVGLCQYGASNLAKKNKSFVKILSHYYPGTKIKRIK